MPTPHEIPSPDQDSAALAQVRAKALQLAGAFAEVFGRPRLRTVAQKQVLAHLETCAGEAANSYNFNDARDGISLIAAGIHRDGAKSLLRVIERQVAKAAESDKKPAPKKSAKR